MLVTALSDLRNAEVILSKKNIYIFAYLPHFSRGLYKAEGGSGDLPAFLPNVPSRGLGR